MISLVILDKLTQQMLEGFAEFVDAAVCQVTWINYLLMVALDLEQVIKT